MALFSRRAAKPSVVSAEVPRGAVSSSASAANVWREARIQQIGAEMLDIARKHKSGLLSKQFWSDKLMDWSMKDQAFKVQLFRFVDAFPMLTTPDAVHDHLIDYLTQPGVTPPPGLGIGLKAGGLAKGMLTSTVSSQITSMAQKFIAGTDAASALPGLKDLWKDGIAFSVDLLGEACLSDEEADAYAEKYRDLIANLPDQVNSWAKNDRLERDHLGAIPRVNVSIKISSLSAKCDPIDTDGSIRELMSRLVPLLELAKQKGVFVNFDMEQFALKDLTIELFQRCCEKVDFHAGLAMQAYLKSGDDDARRLIEWSKRSGRIVSIRLVKGAYWDYETIHAEQMGWPCPVWNTKRETDACFERMAEAFLSSTPRDPKAGGIKLALGSHNVRSIAAAIDGLERRELPREAIELQMLHGMADQLKGAATEMNLRVREYVPVGEMIPGMAYLVRRLLENTSNESWLRAGFLDNKDVGALLASPHSSALSPSGGDVARGEAEATERAFSPALSKPDLCTLAPERHKLSVAAVGVGDGKPFVNEPMRDFSRKTVRETFSAAVQRATVPRIANDKSPQDASRAIAAASAYFPKWRDTDPITRANILIKAAAIMRERRDGLSGVMIKEAGKTWREADADVCEAIDFCEYYAREAMPLFQRKRLGKFIGELDEVWHQPRGVAAVISPWNFPLAICCGMTTAALVTGNTVVMKPAEQTPGIASILADILYEAGLPREALHFLPAPGETTGAALVRDPRIALIAFTGSKAVGLDIIAAASKPGSSDHLMAGSFDGSMPTHVKRVVCEMGGKNAVIIDESADLDEAVVGVRYSAFGFQGQKCSAASRIIVLESAHDAFVHRLVESTRALVVGDPTFGGTDVGPVIDAEAAARIRKYITTAKEEGCTLALAMHPSPIASASPDARSPIPGAFPSPDARSPIPGASSSPNHIGPHIFTNVTPRHTIWNEEIFGPVLAITKAKSFDEALELANNCPYKLTGGVFSRKPSHLERAKREFRVGNLYLNRGCTGALVARQPFGGFAMSGVGSKAGGSEYLLQFVEPRASCENTMRRGFAPEL